MVYDTMWSNSDDVGGIATQIAEQFFQTRHFDTKSSDLRVFSKPFKLHERFDFFPPSVVDK